jgi:undecaprenyl-diphosphatase
VTDNECVCSESSDDTDHRRASQNVDISSPDGQETNLWLILAIAFGFALLAGSFFLDGAVATLVSTIQRRALTAFMDAMTNFGDFSLLILVVACLYGMNLGSTPARAKRMAMLSALALFTTGLCVFVLKFLTARSRDGEFHFVWGWSPRDDMFPSGHAALVCAVSVVLGRVYQPFRWPLFLIVLMVATSRVYLHYHFFSDVVAGILLGLAVSSLILRYADRWA